MSLVETALIFATEKHKNQKRKNATKDPYIVHPVEVMNLLKTAGVTNEVVLASALLHDTVEDTGTTPEELTNVFGEEVTNIVLECSDDKSLHKVERKQIQITHSQHISSKAKLVKLADKLSNVSGLLNDPPSFWSQEEIIGYVRWSWCVCQNLYGENQDLDNAMKNVFAQFNVSNVTSEELESYYQKIFHND